MTKKKPPVAKPLLLTALVGLAAGVLAAVLVLALPAPLPPGQAPQQSTGRALIGGPFTLTDHTGRRVTEKDFAGKPMLVFFGFTHCPDICPSGLQVLAAALDQLGPKAEQLSAVFITLDPERDTPEVMREYVKSFGPHIMGLTGTADEAAAAAKAYRVYAKKTPPDEAGNYSVDHSSFMYLMDAKGEFVKHFPHTVSPDELAQGLATAL